MYNQLAHCSPSDTLLPSYWVYSRMSTKQLLFDTPFTDYTLIADDGREIRVHKVILCMESSMFKAMLLNTSMKQEESMQTECKYEDLLSVVKWMYDFPTEYTDEVYLVADKLIIDRLLDFKLYMPKLNDGYVKRYIDIVNEKIEMTTVEERNLTKISKTVIRVISMTRYNVRCEKCELLTYPLDVIKGWYRSKHRVNNDADMVIFADKYALKVGYDVVNEHLIPYININNTSLNVVYKHVDDVDTKFPLFRTYDSHITYLHLLSYKCDGMTLIRYIMRRTKSYKRLSDIVFESSKSTKDIAFKDVVSEEAFSDFMLFTTRVATNYLI